MTSSATALVIASLSLLTSGLTLWLTLLRSGKLRMTLPTQISFRFGREGDTPQVFLLALLYCTARRGAVVESLFVRLRRGEVTQTFNVWVMGDQNLSRGGGLFVGPEGVACNHYFFPPLDGTRFEFIPGQYTLEVFASVVGRRRPTRLQQVVLTLSAQHVEAADIVPAAVIFDWGPESGSYHAHAREARLASAQAAIDRLKIGAERITVPGAR